MFIPTERLLLRPGWPEDAPELARAFGREAVVMTLARAPWPYTLADAASFLTRDRSDVEANFVIVLREPAGVRLIGGIGLAPDGDELELGYWITPADWGRGYVSEAGRAVVDLARHALRLDRLVSGHFADNPASGRVLEKLGFVRTGSEQRMCAARGEARECLTYALTL